MKTSFTLIILLLVCSVVFGQGRSVSWKKKIKDPIVLSSKDTLKVGDLIELQEGSTEKGQFKFVQLLNNFNEPIQQATSKNAFSKQKILFFKTQDGVYYAFTKFYCINIEPATKANEIKCASIKRLKPDKKKNEEDSSKFEKIRELKKLLDEGAITQEEFENEKKKILN
jgi:hypothetical protein